MTVYVCLSSSCRKQKTSRKQLLEVLSDDHAVEPVSCQKVCKGLVVGCEVGGRLEWFGRLDTKKARRALSKLLSKGNLTNPLEKRRSKKRAGKLR